MSFLVIVAALVAFLFYNLHWKRRSYPVSWEPRSPPTVDDDFAAGSNAAAARRPSTSDRQRAVRLFRPMPQTLRTDFHVSNRRRGCTRRRSLQLLDRRTAGRLHRRLRDAQSDARQRRRQFRRALWHRLRSVALVGLEATTPRFQGAKLRFFSVRARLRRLVERATVAGGHSFGVSESSGDDWKEQRRLTLAAFRQLGVSGGQMQAKILDEVQTTILDGALEEQRREGSVDLSMLCEHAIASVGHEARAARNLCPLRSYAN